MVEQGKRTRGLPDADTMLRDVLHLRGWDVREGQSDMVSSIKDHVNEADPDMIRRGMGISVQAPTGTGKSLGNLISTLPTDQRIVISTSTKALQMQYVNQELPRLKGELNQLYNFDLKFAVLKGLSNYICLEAAKAYIGDDKGYDVSLFDIDPEELRPDEEKIIRAAITRTEEAMSERNASMLDCSDILDQLPSRIRRCVDASRCTDRRKRWWMEDESGAEEGDDSSYPNRIPMSLESIIEDAECPYRMAYALALQADIVVLNTSLLAAELLKSQQVGPLTAQQLAGTGIVIVDEAHHLVDKITDALRQNLDFLNVNSESDSCCRKLSKHRPDLEDRLVQVSSIVEGVDIELTPEITDADGELDTRKAASTLLNRLADQLDMLVSTASTRPSDPDIPFDDGVTKKVRNLVSRLRDDVITPLHYAANSMMVPGEGGFSYDVSWRGLPEDQWFGLDLIPLDLSFFHEDLIQVGMSDNTYIDASEAGYDPDKMSYLILCSGTITDETAHQIGMINGDHHNVKSPFKSTRQRIFVPSYIVEPRGLDAEEIWFQDAWEMARDSIEAVGGRTLFLCTSHRRVERFSTEAMKDLPYPVYYQGNGMGRDELIQRFSEEKESVLVGTQSFWEGVDVPGEALSLVVIDRIPFPVKDDPVMSARRKWVERQNRNPFMSVDVDHAAVTLAQGIGRLIRAEKDLGGVLLLDPRIETRRDTYGKALLKLISGACPYTVDDQSFIDWLTWVKEHPNTTEELPEMDPVYWSTLRPKRRRK